MKKITLIISAVLLAVVLAGWSAYWFVVKSIVEDNVLDWVDVQRQNGVSIEYKDIDFEGFPTKLTMIASEPEYADLKGEIRVSVSQVTASVKLWDFSELQVKPRGVLRVQNGENQLSVELGKQSAITLGQDNEQSIKLKMISDSLQWVVPNHGKVSFSGIDLEADISRAENKIGVKSFVDRIDFPKKVEALPCNGKTSFNNHLVFEIENIWYKTNDSDLLAFELGSGTSIEIKTLNYSHGKMHVQAKSNLEIGANGLLNGTIDLRLEEGDEFLKILSGTCMQGAPNSSQTRFALAALNSGSANGNFITLAVQNGVVKLFGFNVYEFPPVTARGTY